MKKRKSNIKGFTLAELLMVVLILGMIVAVLGGGFTLVRDAYHNIVEKAEAESLLSTTIIKVTDEFRYATDVEVDAETPPRFFSQTSGYQLYLTDGTEEDHNIYKVPCQGTGSDASLRQPLLTEATVTGDMAPKITYSFDPATGCFTATISVESGGEELTSQRIVVRPINQ